MKARAAVAVVGAFLLGLAGGHAVAAPGIVLLVTGLAVLGVAAAIILGERAKETGVGVASWFLVLVAMVVAGWARYPAPISPASWPTEGDRVSLAGTIVSAHRGRGGWGEIIVRHAAMSASDARGEAPGLIRLSVPPMECPPAAGETILASGLVEYPSGPRNPGESSDRDRLRRRGIAATLRVERPGDLLSVGQTSPGPAAGWLPGMRRRYVEAGERHLQGSSLGLYLGVVLGRREELPPALLEAMARAGTTHLLAVSGLNVGLFAILLVPGGRLLGIPRPLAAALAMPVLGLYAALVGAGPSVLRATVMCCALLGGTILGRRTDHLNSLATSALLLLLFMPTSCEEAGFQLSYAAVAGILLFVPVAGRGRDSSIAHRGKSGPLMVRSVRNTIRFLGTAVRTTVAAQLGVLPLLLSLDGRLSLVAPLANLVAVPLSGGAVPLGLALPFVDALSPAWAHAWSASLWLLLYGIEESSCWCASLPGASLIVGSPPRILFALYYAGLTALARGCGRWRAGGGALLAASLLVMIGRALPPSAGALPAPSVEATFMDVGQGDACLLTSSAGSAVLVDAGPGGEGHSAGRERILPLLRRRGIRRLDLVVLTHPHSDHLGGLPDVLRGVTVSALVDGGVVTGSELLLNMLEIARERGVAYRVPVPGETLLDDGVLRVVVLTTPASAGPGPRVLPDAGLNDASLAVAALAEGQSILLWGDLGPRALPELAGAVDEVPCVVMGAPHHGSRAGPTPFLAARVRPAWCVVSAARRNRWGFPHPQTLTALYAAGVSVWEIGKNGSAVFQLRSGECVLRGPDGRVVWRSSPAAPRPRGAAGAGASP